MAASLWPANKLSQPVYRPQHHHWIRALKRKTSCHKTKLKKCVDCDKRTRRPGLGKSLPKSSTALNSLWASLHLSTRPPGSKRKSSSSSSHQARKDIDDKWSRLTDKEEEQCGKRRPYIYLFTSSHVISYNFFLSFALYTMEHWIKKTSI